MANSSCKILTIRDAFTHVSTVDGKRFATVFEHGTLSVEIYAPRGSDPQKPHSRDEIYFVAIGSGQFVCGETRTSSVQPTCSSLRLGLSIALKILLTTLLCGSCFTDRKVEKDEGSGERTHSLLKLNCP